MAGVGSTVRRLYLSVYNWVVFYGWCVAPLPAAPSSSLIPDGILRPASLAGSWFEFGFLLDLGGPSCRAQVLYYAVMTLREKGHEAVYAAVEQPLQFAQTAAIMEV
jgi:very-long-chain (3R)-3-hydroxyacyl-CoA dehydratase